MNFYSTNVLFAIFSIEVLFPFALLLRPDTLSRRPLVPYTPTDQTFGTITKNAEMTNKSLASTNLAFIRWPVRPYDIDLPLEDYSLAVLGVTEYIGKISIDPAELLMFIKEFTEDLKRAYPPPSFAPHRASKRDFDIVSSTKWTIECTDAFLRRIHTETLVLGLDAMRSEIKVHGPASFTGVVHKGRSIRWPDGEIVLSIEKLAGNSLNVSSYSESSDFQAS